MHSSPYISWPVRLAIIGAVLTAGLLASVAAQRFPWLWKPIRWTCVAVSTGSGLSWYLFRIFGLHDPLRWALPLEICDASLWITVIALIWPRQRLLELAYYWGIAGASIALITPYLIAPLISLPSITFLIGHGMILVSVIFLLGTGRMRPSPGSWRSALLILNLFALFDFCFDRLSGTDYMYLVHKPPIVSLLNIMGPWPWYIVAADVLAGLLFFALQWPFRHNHAHS
jgi:hypothetical integral membrane protein (TIGR02206 family)